MKNCPSKRVVSLDGEYYFTITVHFKSGLLKVVALSGRDLLRGGLLYHHTIMAMTALSR